MKKNELSRADMHSAGATVIHRSPFSELAVEQRFETPPAALIERWIKPFYFACMGRPDTLEEVLATRFDEITPGLVEELLAYFNWRPRIVAATFCGLKRYREHEDLLGKLLLRSDVCIAGTAYCHALVRLNSPGYLLQYLKYYLTREDLWFDQLDALVALRMLDERNSTEHAASVMDLWETFRLNKPNWSLEGHDDFFRENHRMLSDMADRLSGETDQGHG